MNFFGRPVLTGMFCTLLALSSVALGAGRCDTDRCYSRQKAEVQQRVLKGETVITTQSDGASPFDMVYAMRLIPNVDSELIAGMFASVDEHSVNVPAISEVQSVRRADNSVLVRYQLDVKRLIGDAGGLASKAPMSRYAIVNHYAKRTDGSYLIWWEIDAAETARMNPKKGLFGGIVTNMGEPEHVHGYLLVEPLAGTSNSVVTYANYVIPKSPLARPLAGTLNKTAGAVVLALVARFTSWAEGLAAKPSAIQKRYRDRICELLLTK